MAGLTTAYTDPVCSGHPLILEEFGAWGVWNDEPRYDADAHYALATGAAAAMSYEWGISWLARELNFWPPLPSMVARHPSLADVRNTPSIRRAVGLFPAPSGFNWGSIYHGTPFPAAAAIALGRLGLMGQTLGRVSRPEKVYVLVPRNFNGDRGNIKAVLDAIRVLWQQHVIFEVWQEDCLGALPSTARILICPNGVTPDSRQELERLRRTGVEVLSTDGDHWLRAVSALRLPLAPADGIYLMARRTKAGTLYSLIRAAPDSAILQPVKLTTQENMEIALGLRGYALVQDGSAGVNLIEAAGSVLIGGKPFCNIEKGRAILATDGTHGLTGARRIRVLATEPGTIHFPRPIRSISVLQDGIDPIATLSPEAGNRSALTIDGELVRYVLEVEFAR